MIAGARRLAAMSVTLAVAWGAGHAAGQTAVEESRASVRVLFEALRSPDDVVRLTAARHLAATDENLAPYALDLAIALRDEQEAVRLEVLHAIRRLGNKGQRICRASLEMAAFDDPSEEVAKRAAELLRRGGAISLDVERAIANLRTQGEEQNKLEELLGIQRKSIDDLYQAASERDVLRLANVMEAIFNDSRLIPISGTLERALNHFGEDGRLAAKQVRYLTADGSVPQLDLLLNAAESAKTVDPGHVIARSLLPVTLKKSAALGSNRAAGARSELARAIGRTGRFDDAAFRLIDSAPFDSDDRLLEALLEGLVERTESLRESPTKNESERIETSKHAVPGSRLRPAAPDVIAAALVPTAQSGPSERMRSMALTAVTRLAPRHPCTADAVLAAISQDPSAAVRRRAMTCLSEIPEPPADVLSRVVEFLETDDSPTAQLAALRVLQRLAGEDDVLEKRIRDAEHALLHLQHVAELTELIAAEKAVRDETQRARRQTLLNDLTERGGPAP